MKKYLLLSVLAAFVFCVGCKSGINSIPDLGNNVNTSLEVSVDTSRGYQPATANSFIKYAITTNGGVADTLTNTVLGTNSTINKKLYYAVSQFVKSTGGTTINFMSNINHAYSLRDNTSISGTPTDILYLIDNVPVGSTWIAQFTDTGTLSGSPARITGALVEKNVKKTINGKVFNYVVHTTIQLQHDVGAGFITYGTYDFYIANGIGIIELDAVTGFPGVPAVKTTEVLADYSIK